MMSSVLCESPRVRHPQEKCASKCVRSIVSLCLHLFFIIATKKHKDTKNIILNKGGDPCLTRSCNSEEPGAKSYPGPTTSSALKSSRCSATFRVCHACSSTSR